MAYTYSKISTVTVGSGGTLSINFIAIPQNYTDLLLLCSLRNTRASSGPGYATMLINGKSNQFSRRRLYVNEDGTVGSNSGSDNDVMFSVATDAQTANVFGNSQIYFPNYTSSNLKSFAIEETSENNSATNINKSLLALLWSYTEPITSIEINSSHSSLSFKQYSTATLYGIKAEV